MTITNFAAFNRLVSFSAVRFIAFKVGDRLLRIPNKKVCLFIINKKEVFFPLYITWICESNFVFLMIIVGYQLFKLINLGTTWSANLVEISSYFLAM